MDFDYKKHSLNKLNEWMHDALSVSEATPQEIYDVIKRVVSENYYIYKNETEKCYELLALLNGNGKGHIQAYDDYVKVCDKDDPSPECKKSWNDFWEEHYYPEECDVKSTENERDQCREYNLREAEYYDKRVQLDAKKDKVVKWQLPVEVDGLSGECYVRFPDDLLESANLKEGDTVEWIDNNDGSFTMRKVNGTK